MPRVSSIASEGAPTRSEKPTVDSVFSPGIADWISWIARAVAYVCFFLVAAPFLYHLSRGSVGYLGFLEDDYFYYAAIADNLVRFGKLTYDGVTLTNGFHPLWEILLTTTSAPTWARCCR
jgi:hypothetical protein